MEFLKLWAALTSGILGVMAVVTVAAITFSAVIVLAVATGERMHNKMLPLLNKIPNWIKFIIGVLIMCFFATAIVYVLGDFRAAHIATIWRTNGTQ